MSLFEFHSEKQMNRKSEEGNFANCVLIALTLFVRIAFIYDHMPGYIDIQPAICPPLYVSTMYKPNAEITQHRPLGSQVSTISFFSASLLRHIAYRRAKERANEEMVLFLSEIKVTTFHHFAVIQKSAE